MTSSDPDKNSALGHNTGKQAAKPVRKQDWCLSAILSLIFGALTAFIFFYLFFFGAGDDGYAIIYSIYTAPPAFLFGLWGLFYWRSSIAAIGLALALSPLAALGFL